MEISTTVLWVLFLYFVCLPQRGETESELSGNCMYPTPPNFQTDFLLRCVRDYGYSEDKCNTAWNNFLGVFANKRAENVQQEDYNLYFDTLRITVKRDHCLFWSGTSDLAEILTMMEKAGVEMMTSHSVKPAQLINGFGPELCWCSSPGNLGLDTGLCPSSTTVHFWAQFSVRLAEEAKGSAFYLVDGMRNPAYSQTSLFSCYELQNLNIREVTQLVVLNIHTGGESCGTQSLAQLCEDTTARGIKCICYNIEGVVGDRSQDDAIVKRLANRIKEIQNDGKQETPSTKNFNNGISAHCQCSIVVTLLIPLVYCLVGAI